jgi:hypothetical protein
MTKCFSYRLTFQNLITRGNKSCVPLQIHKSKFTIASLHLDIVGNSYNCLHFSINLNNTCCENNFLERNITQKHECVARHFNQTLSTNYIGKWFFTINRPRCCKNLFLLHIIFFFLIFYTKCFWYWPTKKVSFFLCSLSFKLVLLLLLFHS